MWRKTENSNETKPLAIDTETSSSVVYFRRNFVFVGAEEGEQARPAHWEYEEQEITKDLYDTYTNIQDLNNAITELAEIISEVVNG